MAFQTAEVLSFDEVYDALISFMTANGWSAYDNIPISGSRDKVLYSAGSDNKLNMYYRISSNLVGGPIKDPNDVHARLPYILFRGYHSWNPTSHSGSGEYGVYGPSIWGQARTGGNHFIVPFLKGDDTLAFPNTPTIYRYSSFTYSAASVNSFDGRRKLWSGLSNGVGFQDIASPESFSSSTTIGNTSELGAIIYKDLNTDKEFVYVIDSTNSNLYRFDVDAGAWQFMSTAPWGALSNNGCFMVCDGVDTIYAARGSATTSFAKYSISTNTWTSLAVLPVALPTHSVGSSQTSNRVVFIPSSVTGFSEDVLYMLIADTGTVIYRYDITSNVWRTTGGTGALTAPATIVGSAHLFWDKQRFLYYGNTATTNSAIWRSDLQTAPGTFVSLSTALDTATRVYDMMHIMNWVTSKIRGSRVLPMKYFFHGDVDSVRVVVRIGTTPANGRYYWSYLGKYDTNYRPEIMGVTGPVASGVRTLVPVDSLVGFNEGQDVIFAGWSGSNGTSHFEKTTIFEFSGSNAFYCNLTSSFTSGTKIGTDPGQNILTGDSWMGGTAIDANGYESNFEPSWYNVQPTISISALDKHAPSVRGVYMPVPFKIISEHTASNAKYEELGLLKNVFVLPKRPFPGPQNEDILTIGSQQFLYFNPQEQQRMVDTRAVVIGPL